MPGAIFAESGHLSKCGDTFDGCEAMGALWFDKMTLEPGESHSYVVVLSYNDEGLSYLDFEKAGRAFEEMKIYWNKETNSKNIIGKRVRELRTERNLSQKALAEQLQLCGYDFNDLTILRIEQGTRFVPDYEVVAIADFFKVSLEYLVGRTEKR